MAIVRRSLLVLLTAVVPAVAAAQSSPPADPPRFSAGYEWHRDRLRYSFDNPSSFDSEALVPHNYTQTYWSDNHWLVARARYGLGDSVFTTEFGATPLKTGRASDIDTFYNPDGDVITSGTDGAARMHAWRFAQWSHGRVGGVPLRLGYKYRRDMADFAPADVVVTRTRPPFTSRRFTTDEEYTTSQVHEVAFDVSHPLVQGARWRLVSTVSASPVVIAQLSTRLPQKYPGRVIRSIARGAAVTARVQAESVGRRWPVVVGVEWGKTVSYQASRSFDRDALELSVGLTW